MQLWSDGIFLLDRYSKFKVGCWILINGSEVAILEMPPYSPHQQSPAATAKRLIDRHGVTVKYLLCSHVHRDHFYPNTAREFVDAFPDAQLVVQEQFRYRLGAFSADYFAHHRALHLDGEPIHLVHAPKHSWSDTMIAFRGAMFTGDWVLNSLRSVNRAVPAERKHQSIRRMMRFQQEYDYRINKTFSVHANDRREGIDFAHLMWDTGVDRPL